MFDQKEYINDYIKNNYKTIKLRIRNDNSVIIDKLNNVDNVNKYLTELIMKDIYENRVYNFIDDSIKIDFDLSVGMRDLVEKAEKADLLNDYGLYMNLADAIDSRAKKETGQHILRESQWNKLIKRYCL
ncbi:MAG: hypothetical protein J5656_05685 [Clostridia bacterium]|nr:hypothetical protein [Clostridia bacterium]